ncbi:MAG TPA: hypothetical protein VEP90_06480 [Methylomirabilota bacterium]|nr:hypothetical protein [Methylomirabilota bacterium]
MRNILEILFLNTLSTLLILLYFTIGVFACGHQLEQANKDKDLPRWYHLIWGIPAVILFWPKQYWDKIKEERRARQRRMEYYNRRECD